MTIDEAIEELKATLLTQESFKITHHTKSLQLGIEALKRELWRRERYANDPIVLLPGETKE